MVVLTPAEIRRIDREAASVVSTDELIERAASALYDVIMPNVDGKRALIKNANSVLIVVGGGNNGRDGLLLYDKLKNAGADVVALSVADKGDVLPAGVITDLGALDSQYDIVIDAVFGIGLDRQLSGIYLDIIKKMNKMSCYKIAVDIPSGLCGENGLILGDCFIADLTITFVAVKQGMLLGDGRDCCGEIVICDIGLLEYVRECGEVVTDKDARRFFLKRKINTHKGTYGRAAVAAGSKKYLGAARLSATSALQSGAGYCYLLTDEDLIEAQKQMLPEVIVCNYCDKQNIDSIAIGMGLGGGEETKRKVLSLVEMYRDKRIILDADALGALSAEQLPERVIITPHILEMARLLDISKEQLLSRPVYYAQQLAKQKNIVVVLKSATTIITDGESVHFNLTGTPALAKGGSGDVLSGIMVALLARNDDMLRVAIAATYLLGRAGEIATQHNGEDSVLASDVIQAIKELKTPIYT